MESEIAAPSFAYRCLIAYDGTEYKGWQVQPNGLSIQEICEKVLKRILQEDIHLVGSGRTDAGVHAKGQVGHFHCLNKQTPENLIRSINALLPPDIRWLDLRSTSLKFHARYDALAKTYAYHFSLGRTLSPFERNYRLHVGHTIDFARLNQAIRLLLGTHDFSGFANESERGVASHDPIRTLTRIELIAEPNGWRLEFCGDGFLYKMVRNMVGTLFEIASGRRPPEDISAILNSRDRRLAGQAAPAHGLFLVKVEYPEERG